MMISVPIFRVAAMAVLGVKDFIAARKMLEKWLQDYDAGKQMAS